MSNNNDPLEFIKGMWSSMGVNLPGMVTPTLDVDELEKRITDMKAVEGWLKMNLNMLSMSIQGLEMQRATLSAVKAMSQSASGAESETKANPFAAAAMNPALWPWNMMQQAGAQGDAPAAAKPSAAKRSAAKPDEKK